MNPLSVRRHPLWGFPDAGSYGFNVWQFDCRFCDREMEFAHWPVAIAWAIRHAQKHAQTRCGSCGTTQYLSEEWS